MINKNVVKGQLKYKVADVNIWFNLFKNYVQLH